MEVGGDVIEVELEGGVEIWAGADPDFISRSKAKSKAADRRVRSTRAEAMLTAADEGVRCSTS